MSTPAPSASPPTGATATAPEQLLVNLQIVSPSLSVNRPLLFPELPATTTIKDLKDRIRQTLPLRPADDCQRLIHRGRALLRASDTLLEIFGPEALRTPDRQTIHLVIRDLPEGQTMTSPTTAPRGPSPVQPTGTPRPPNPQFGPEPPPGFSRRGHVQVTTHHVAQPRVPSPAPAQHSSEQATTFQHHHQNMSNWLGQVQRDAQLQREAMVRALVNQSQRGRAQMGMRGIGDAAGNSGPEPSSGRVSPGASHAAHYETVGPNGQTYQVDNVVRSSTQGISAGLSPAEVQNVMRSADSNQAAMAMANALQRGVPGPALYNRPLTQPGVTTPILGAGGSLAGSGRATPELDPRLVGGGTPPAARASSPGQPQQGTQVYLLLSPEGPRALLFNSSTAEMYYSPRLGSQASLPRLRSPASQSNLSHHGQLSDAHAAPQQDHGPRQDAQPQPRDDAAAPGPAPARPPLRPAHPNNAAAAGLPPLMLQLWPHLWLIFRLSLFVWFFTSPNSSWSRWLTIICLAIFMFVLSTGLLNGLAENVWRPIGRHLENVLPALEAPRIARVGPDAGRDGRDSEGDPGRLAARLVAERRARHGWLAGQVRRLERAGLLFLASLAPGVAERHIANIEAEARAEENRRREEEAAAAGAAAGGAGGEAETDGGEDNVAGAGDAGNDGQEEQRGEHAEHEGGQAHAGGEPNREEIAAL